MIVATFTLPGEYTIQLATNDTKSHWYVTYGLQKPYVTTDYQEAWREFNSCVRHSSECAGLLDADD